MNKRARTDVERPPLPTDAQLQLLSDSGSFKRAQSYVRSGAVEITARSDKRIDAIVSIAAVYEAAGRHREATQWAERGLKAHPDWRGMRPLLARQYERAGLTDEALELYWQDFQRQPTVDTWQALKNAAGQQWSRYRTRALEEVCRRERALPDRRRDASLRTRLLIADHDFEAARVLAEQYALAPELLDGLAQRIATTHPECAAGLLRRFVDAVLPRCQPRNYAYQAQQIARILALSPGPSSRAWVNQIRVQYSARRKFIAQLDAAMTPGEGPSRARSR